MTCPYRLLVTLLFLVLAGTFSNASAQSVRLCYQKGAGIYVAADTGQNPVRVVRDHASDPCISPDGKSVAYTLDTSGDADVVRRIAVVDVATQKSRVLDAVPGTNSYRPIWSPDGSMLMIQHFRGSDWDIAVVGADNTGFRVLTDSIRDQVDATMTGAYWAPDGASVYAYDFKKFYRIDLSGKVISATPIEALLGDSLSSGYTFSLNPDGAAVLFDVEAGVPDIKSDEPTSIVMLANTGQSAAKRVSPLGQPAVHPCWHPDGKTIYFSSYARTGPGIYQMAVGDKKARLVVAGGEWPSLSGK